MRNFTEETDIVNLGIHESHPNSSGSGRDDSISLSVMEASSQHEKERREE